MTDVCSRCSRTDRVWAEVARLGSVMRQLVRCPACRGSGWRVNISDVLLILTHHLHLRISVGRHKGGDRSMATMARAPCRTCDRG